jgi:protein SCO1/2
LPEVHADRGDSPFRLTPSAGHVLVVYFGYTTCPDVCPTTLSDLHRALALLGGDARRVEVAFVTVDRERDTPAQLAPYLAAFVAGGHPLRPASDAQLVSAEQAFGASSSISRTPAGDVEVSHTGTMYVVDASGRIAVEWPFGSTPKIIAHDLGALLAGRAASGATSSAR